MLKIAVLVSGSGSNLQAVIDNAKSGKLDCSIEMVISDRAGVMGLKRASDNGIPAYVADRKQLGDGLSDTILELVRDKVDLIVLAGFLSVLKGELLTVFKDRIINIHPALIPAFCGPNMYGLKVHQAAIDYGVKFSGCTVHSVDSGTDTGAILLQKVVPVLAGDTAQVLQQRVLEQEHVALSEAIGLIAQGKVKIDGRTVTMI